MKRAIQKTTTTGAGRGAALATVLISAEAMVQLKAVRDRTGHKDIPSTMEWLIRAEVDRYQRLTHPRVARAEADKADKEPKP